MKKLINIKMMLFFAVHSFVQTSINAQTKNSVELSFSPCGGNVLIGAYNGGSYGVESRFSYGAAFEFQHHAGKWITIGVGLEYYQHRYGSSAAKYTFDSSYNMYITGYSKSSLNHHYIGLPLKMYVNFINKDKVKIYGYAGFTPRIVADIASDSREYNLNNDLVEGEYQSIFTGPYNPSRFALEFQFGYGGRFNFTPRFYLSASVLFALNCTSTLNSGNPGSVNPMINNYRFGGNIGLGHNF